ncbi:hypothetical protein CPB85DRAFT_1330871 [Mucidula mucida]|nr:hypothetical protein CPB85DRAFT_1330871 [Mucidula mucida]
MLMRICWTGLNHVLLAASTTTIMAARTATFPYIPKLLIKVFVLVLNSLQHPPILSSLPSSPRYLAARLFMYRHASLWSYSLETCSSYLVPSRFTWLAGT